MKETIIGLVMGISVATAPFFTIDIQSNIIFNILIGVIVLYIGWYLSGEKPIYRWSNIILGTWILVSGSYFKCEIYFLLSNLASGIALIAFSLYFTFAK